MPQINEYLKTVVGENASDLHVIAGQPPRMRLYGALKTMQPEINSAETTKAILAEVMPTKNIKDFDQNDSTDFAHEIEGLARFRVNVFRHLAGMGAVFRTIPSRPKSLAELGMPSALKMMCKASQGLILVTGKTGSGKSTTLAAMIDEINTKVNGHILTIEDPIEYVHQRKGCLISQREVGKHSESFASALNSALREDPDVILVGELRDAETMRTAMQGRSTPSCSEHRSAERASGSIGATRSVK